VFNDAQRLTVCLRPTLKQRIHLTLKVTNKTNTNPTKQSGRKIYRLLANVVLAIRKEEVLGDQRPIVLLEENDGNGVS